MIWKFVVVVLGCAAILIGCYAMMVAGGYDPLISATAALCAAAPWAWAGGTWAAS